MAAGGGGGLGNAVHPGHGERVGAQENVVMQIEVSSFFVVNVHFQKTRELQYTIRMESTFGLRPI